MTLTVWKSLLENYGTIYIGDLVQNCNESRYFLCIFYLLYQLKGLRERANNTGFN